MFTRQATDFILNIFHCCCAIFIKVGGFVKSNRKASTKNRKRKRSSCGRRAAAAGPSHFLYIRPFAQTLSLSLSFSFSLSHFFHSSISHLISLFCLLFTLSLSPSLSILFLTLSHFYTLPISANTFASNLFSTFIVFHKPHFVSHSRSHCTFLFLTLSFLTVTLSNDHKILYHSLSFNTVPYLHCKPKLAS